MVPSHYLNQCWNIVNWTLGNKLWWNLNRNWYIFIQENAFETVVCKMVAILTQPQSVNWHWDGADTSLMQDGYPCTWQSQYHGCWWPGDTRNLVIKKHVIFLALLEYPGFITRSIDNIWKDGCWLIKSWKNIRWQVQVYFFKENYLISIQICRMLVSRGSIKNQSWLIQVMAWC